MRKKRQVIAYTIFINQIQIADYNKFDYFNLKKAGIIIISLLLNLRRIEQVS